MRQHAANKRIAPAGALPHPPFRPLSQIRERTGVPPERHAPRLLTLGCFATQPIVRPSAVHIYIVESQCADLRNTQSATARDPDDDQVALRVQRSLSLLACVTEHG